MSPDINQSQRGNPLARFALTALLVIGIVVLAFSFGTFVGGKFFVPAGQGLAGPAEAIGYGLLAALLATALAIFAGFKLPFRPLAITSAIACGIAVLLVGAIAIAYVSSEDFQNPRAEQVNPHPTTAPAVEPPCPLPEGDDTTYGHPPCQDE